MKKIILTSDDFGIDNETNEAIAKALSFGTLSGACLMANMESFDNAIENVYKNFPNMDVGVHLNIIEGKALTKSEKSTITDEFGNFNNSYIDMLKKSFDKKFNEEVEKEFRAQIEKVFNKGLKASYINTHVHTHSIPAQFELVCKLAKEYGIKNIRTQGEIPYFTRKKPHFSIRYFLNIIKNVLLNTFTFINKKTLKKYELNTNDYFIGVLYTGMMDENTIIEGIKALSDNSVAEIILHPAINPEKERHYREYQALCCEKLKNFLDNNTELTKWKDLN